jgi:hypothetical protein
LIVARGSRLLYSRIGSGLFAETALLREAAAEQSGKMSPHFGSGLALETVANALENNARLQLRAYVGARMARVLSCDGGSSFQVEVEMLNARQTPAGGVTHCLAAELQILHSEPLTARKRPGRISKSPRFVAIDCVAANSEGSMAIVLSSSASEWLGGEAKDHNSA